MAMSIIRMLTQNIYYYITDALSPNWSNVKVVAAPVEDVTKLSIPTVAIVSERLIEDPLEIGSVSQIRSNLYILQCYCKSDGQRDDLGDFLKNLFTETSTEFLDYNDGFPPSGGQDVLGRIYFKFITMNPVHILGSPHPANKHRMDIRMSSEIIGL